jgi:hypothetical protein
MLIHRQCLTGCEPHLPDGRSVFTLNVNFKRLLQNKERPNYNGLDMWTTATQGTGKGTRG